MDDTQIHREPDDVLASQTQERDVGPEADGLSGDGAERAEPEQTPEPRKQARRRRGLPAWTLGLLILALTGVLVWAGDAYIRSRQQLPVATREAPATSKVATPTALAAALPTLPPAKSATPTTLPPASRPTPTPATLSLPPTPAGKEEALILVADLEARDGSETAKQERTDALYEALRARGREVQVKRLDELLDESEVYSTGLAYGADYVLWGRSDASDATAYLRRTDVRRTEAEAIRPLSPRERSLVLSEPVETAICLSGDSAGADAGATAFALGVAAYRQGDAQEAQTLLGEALAAADPEARCGSLVSHAHLYLGNLAALAGEYDTALNEYETGLESAAEPEDQARLHSNQASVYAALENAQAALAAADQALNLDPEQANAYLHRANAYRALERPADALVDLDRAVELDPEHARAYASRGLLLHNAGEFEAALEDYGRALELDPWAAEVYLNRGGTYATLGSLDAALADYGLALALKPDDPDIYYNRGTVYAMQESYVEALDDLDRALELKPEFAQVYGNRGLVYKAMGETQKAIADLEAFVRLTDNPQWRAMIKAHLEELEQEQE